eukprot:14510253-Alexandrium_andersonii.AAC.1
MHQSALRGLRCTPATPATCQSALRGLRCPPRMLPHERESSLLRGAVMLGELPGRGVARAWRESAKNNP